MKSLIKNYWRGIVLLFAGIVMFFVYAWFPIDSSRDLYKCGLSSDKTQSVKVGNVLLQANSEETCSKLGSAENIYKFNSPDEALNFFWSSAFAKAPADRLFDSFYYQEPLEEIGNNLIRPRSVNVVGDKVMPGSFMGMYFIYGGIGKLVNNFGLDGVHVLFYLTALFAVIGIWFFYRLISLIFNKNIALISSLLAFIFPGFVYYAERSFYHNVLFVSLLIIGIFWLLNSLQFNGHSELVSESNPKTLKQAHLPASQIQGDSKKKLSAWLLNLLGFILAGFFIGLSLITRSSEVGWVILTVVLIFIFSWRKFFGTKINSVSKYLIWHNWLGVVLFAAFLMLPFIPVFLVNYKLYGAPLSIGYDTGLAGDLAGLVSQPGLVFRLLVSPFGINLKSILVNGYDYLFKFFWYFTIPAVVGVLFCLINIIKNRKTRPVINKQSGYLIILAIISIYLLIYYGSWQIVDRIDRQTVSIGTSYVRYFLPIYLGLLPFMAYLINYLVGLIKNRQWPKPIIVILLLGILMLPSYSIAFVVSDESLFTIRDNIRQTQAKFLRLRTVLTSEAIIVFGFKQADKIFFPEYRRTIPELVVPFDYESVARLAQHTDIYYYHFADPSIVVGISESEFEPFGIKINPDGVNTYSRDWLYKIELLKK